MKYVVFKNELGFLFPVVFPDCVSHDQMKMTGCTPDSAGFFDLYKGEACGKSIGLKIGAVSTDSALLGALLTNNNALLPFLQVPEVPHGAHAARAPFGNGEKVGESESERVR